MHQVRTCSNRCSSRCRRHAYAIGTVVRVRYIALPTRSLSHVTNATDVYNEQSIGREFDSRRLRKLFFSSCLMLETFTKKL